ncbi:MAG: NERD domain-containing protein [Oscillospiraceae bacterium]|jgi:ssDNA-binding Zn-finger/Zn-ribbon topoisomerase 1
MGLFDKIKGPAFLKDDSEAERQLTALQELRKTAAGDLAEELDQEIRQVNAGIYGENVVRYELENSHIPMIVLHDIFLEHEGLTAQIDYLIVTRKHQFILECKNLFGNIEVSSSGDFIRTVSFGRRTKKEGIYSPITQNRRHLELIKQIRGAEKGNFLSKTLFEKNFYNNYRSVVVLANPKTVLNARYAKKEVRDQVIRADQLAEYIRKADADPNAVASSEKDMEALAQFFLSIHQQPKIDYTAKFREACNTEAASVEETESVAVPTAAGDPAVILCPKCGAPMILRKAMKGPNAGKEFYGCANFPKCRGIVQIQ